MAVENEATCGVIAIRRATLIVVMLAGLHLLDMATVVHRFPPENDLSQAGNSSSGVFGRSQAGKGVLRKQTKPKGYHMEAWKTLWESNINSYSKSNANLSKPEMERRFHQLSAALKNNTLSEVALVGRMLSSFPDSRTKASMELYNHEAYIRLISNLIKVRDEGRNFTLVANGGSTTAGAGSLKPYQRYYSRFGKFLNGLLSKNNKKSGKVEIVGQGHGTRNSFHSAALFDYFIPQNTDLLIWEFSINDAETQFKENDRLPNLNFLPWLHEVSRMQHPPPVILLYYWDASFHHNDETKKVEGRSFKAHGDIPKQFDFIVGHVNIGAYLDELDLSSCWDWAGCPFLSDRLHPSALGHLATSYLLLKLLSPPTEPPSLIAGKESTKYEWSCGEESPAKRILKQTITDSRTGWKSPLGSWTLELPALENQQTSRRLVSEGGKGDIDIFSRENPNREDKKRSTSLTFCDDDSVRSFSVKAPAGVINNFRVILLSFKYKGPILDSAGINVKINDSNMTSKGDLVPMTVTKDPTIVNNWPCHISEENVWGGRSDVYWFVFDTLQQSVRSIDMCQRDTSQRISRIQSIVLW